MEQLLTQPRIRRVHDATTIDSRDLANGRVFFALFALAVKYVLYLPLKALFLFLLLLTKNHRTPHTRYR